MCLKLGEVASVGGVLYVLAGTLSQHPKSYAPGFQREARVPPVDGQTMWGKPRRLFGLSLAGCQPYLVRGLLAVV